MRYAQEKGPGLWGLWKKNEVLSWLAKFTLKWMKCQNQEMESWILWK